MRALKLKPEWQLMQTLVISAIRDGDETFLASEFCKRAVMAFDIDVERLREQIAHKEPRCRSHE
jgi:hypothetical protein